MATQATLYIQLMVTIQILPFVLFFLQPFFDTAMQTLGVRWSGWFSREHWQWVPRGISELSVGGSNLTSMGYRKRNVPPLFLSPPPSTQQSFTLWGGGGGGRPEIQPFTLLYALLYDRKGTLFVYLPLTNDASCTYVLLNAPPLLTAVNAVFFKIWKTKQNTKPGNFFDSVSQP